MSGFMVLDMAAKKVIALCVCTGVACLGLGVIIGYFPGRGGSDQPPPGAQPLTSPGQGAPSLAGSGTCNYSGFSETALRYSHRYIQKTTDGQCLHVGETCDTYGLPRAYLAYHLNGQTITIDGRLDDPAWQQVPWTQDFVDIRSSLYPAPRFETKVKVRWDDASLYVGAYLQETDIAAFINVTDGNINMDNDFEMLLATDGTMHNYKQLLINAFGVASDFEFYSGPYDNDPTTFLEGRAWSSGIQSAVYTAGTLNVPGDTDTYWTVEWSLDFKQLFKHTEKEKHDHITNDVWFINFGRAEYHFATNGNQYVKDTSRPTDWWSWQECGAVNLHLQSRWGLLQFKKSLSDTVFDFKLWHVYKSLFEVYDALRAYKGMNGKYTDQLEELNVAPYLFSGACVGVPQVSVSGDNFNVTVTSTVNSRLSGTINQNRYVFMR